MPITYHEDQKIWILTTKSIAYVMGVDEEGGLQHLYWGDQLPLITDYPIPSLSSKDSSFESSRSLVADEYSAWGGIKYSEPCLKVTFADGIRNLILVFDSYKISNGIGDGCEELIVILKDVNYDLNVYLHYKLFQEFDLIERYVEITNRSPDPIHLEQILSAEWSVPKGTGYRLTYLTGRWAAETQLRRMAIQEGKFVLESRRGFTSPQMNPWFAIDAEDRATEENGQVWFGALAWSGSWKIVVEQSSLQQLHICGGIHDFDFNWLLEPGENFKTPSFIGGYTTNGFGAASRNMHHYQLKYILPVNHRYSIRKVLYNSWEATKFQVTAEGQMLLAEKAAQLGIELFVVDDGWFGGRHSEEAGLGDWYPNPVKFPQGLKPLINRVNGLGMDFGLWVEPEMVNPDSDLYRNHPDWVYHFPNRPRLLARNQLILNLCRQDVRKYLFECLNLLLSTNNISFLKWDANRNISEPGWPSVQEGREKEIWVRHTLGLYEIIDHLRMLHPNIMIESCSGGGGRIDLGILQRFDQVWPSDSTDAFDRLKIQEGFSHAYCPKVMMAWVTDSPNFINKREVSLTYRFHSAMMGSLGIGGNLNIWSEEDMKIAQREIAEYKEFRTIVQEGDLYRLLSPSEGNIAAFQYVSADKQRSVLFVFSHSIQFRTRIPRLRLKGLKENSIYHLFEVSTMGESLELSGKALISLGIELNMAGDFDSRLFQITAIGNV